MTKFQLFAALAAPRLTGVINVNGIEGVLSSIEREDGSGSSFNITLQTAVGMVCVYLRTLD